MLENPLVQVLGIFQGLDGQLTPEEIAVGAVLAEGLGPLTGLPVEAHEQTVNVLLERVKDEETLTGGYGLILFTLGNEALDETGQGAEKEQEKAFPFKDDPLLEVGRVGKRESGQELSPVEVKRPMDPADALRSGGETRLRVLEACLEDLFEIANIHPAGSRGWDKDPRALDCQTGFGGVSNLGKCAAEVPKGTAEIVTSPGLGDFTP